MAVEYRDPSRVPLKVARVQKETAMVEAGVGVPGEQRA
jgi:hypothetical protein